jgi:hypothetical protein
MEMTRQEIYNKVATHLLAQNEVSKNELGRCLYRGPRGLKCGIGVLIPDDVYDPCCENTAADQLHHRLSGEFCRSIGTRRDGAFLCGLQAIHDNWQPQDWANKLREFALVYSLIPI